MKAKKLKITHAEPLGEKVPSPPSWLSAWCKKMFRRIAVDEGRKLSTSDCELLGAYVQHLENMRKAQKEIEKNGIVIEGTTGARKNPALTALADASRLLVSIGAELGLSPTSRQRFIRGGKQARDLQDSFEKFRMSKHG